MPGFTEHSKGLDFILSVMGRHGRVFEREGNRENREEATAIVSVGKKKKRGVLDYGVSRKCG